MEITKEYRVKVWNALMDTHKNWTGSDASFARKYNINTTVFSTMKKGDLERKISDDKWVELGMMLDVYLHKREWKFVRTDVFNAIESAVLFCKEFSKGKIFVDECAIGKTFSSQYLSRTVAGCYYVDCSQAKSKKSFMEAIAQTLGVSNNGTYETVKKRVKYCLKVLPKPVIILDEAGDLYYEAFLDIKELYNASVGICGWILIGADGLRKKIMAGISSEKNGYREIFSRLADRFSSIIPTDTKEKITFYKKLITDVLSANVEDKKLIKQVVNKCLDTDLEEGESTGLRRAESLLILMSPSNAA